MSNPGVIELSNVMIGGENLRIEDNIGEAIHIHYGNIRLDMTIKEFVLFANKLMDIAQNIVDVPSFSFKNYDAIFLSEASELLCDLVRVEFMDVSVDELKTDFVLNDFAGLIPISNARISQALHGDTRNNETHRQTNYWGENNTKRLAKIYESIKEKGYHPDIYGKYIVLIDNGRYIIDGCHRASSILELQGNIKISIAMWHTREGFFTDAYKDRELEMQLAEQRRKILQTEQRKRLISMLVKQDLSGKKVIIKGAGKHTQEILPIFQECGVHVVGITANNKVEGNLYGFPFLDEENLADIDADVIFLSSWKYRKEMRCECEQYRNKFLIYDIYEKGIEYEFFS